MVGMGGSGKTTSVKQVFDDANVKKRFDVYVWITISHPFRIEEQLFEAIRKPVPQGVDNMNTVFLKMVVKGFLQARKYLIVLDYVWHIMNGKWLIMH